MRSHIKHEPSEEDMATCKAKEAATLKQYCDISCQQNS